MRGPDYNYGLLQRELAIQGSIATRDFGAPLVRNEENGCFGC